MIKTQGGFSRIYWPCEATVDQSHDTLARRRVQTGISFAALKGGEHEPRRVQMAAEFVIFPTRLPVTQPGRSDNLCTRIKMSQETATSTPVCKMVIQRCLRQSERSGGWNCRPLNPLTLGRTGDEMKTLSSTAQYLSYYEQNTTARKKARKSGLFQQCMESTQIANCSRSWF